MAYFINEFSGFKLGDTFNVLNVQGNPDFFSDGRFFSVVKVIAVNPVDKSVTFQEPITNKANSYVIPNAITSGTTFELLARGDITDPDVVNAQSKTVTWFKKFEQFKSLVMDLFKKEAFKLTISSAATAVTPLTWVLPAGVESSLMRLNKNDTAKLNQAVSMIVPLIKEYNSIPFLGMTIEQRKTLHNTLTELNNMLSGILKTEIARSEDVAKLYNLLEQGAKVIIFPIKAAIDLGGKAVEDFWDWLTGDWKRIAIATAITGAVGTGAYFYFRRR